MKACAVVDTGIVTAQLQVVSKHTEEMALFNTFIDMLFDVFLWPTKKPAKNVESESLSLGSGSQQIWIVVLVNITHIFLPFLNREE